MEKRVVSIYLRANYTNSHRQISIEEVLSIMKSGKAFGLESVTKKLRTAEKDGKPDLVKRIKQGLPSFITAGLCKGNRSAANFDSESYTGLVILDIDDIDDQEEDKEAVLEKTKSISYTYAAFTSPKGRGIKIIVKVNTTAKHHKVAYEQVQRYYQQQLGVSVDAASDIVRLCFMCHAPDLYQNSKSKVYVIQPVMTITDIINFTNKKVPFVPGNRNNYTFLLACNLNRAGIDKNSATGEITRLFSESDFKEEEIRKILNSAYTNSIEHGKYKYESSFGQIKETISVDDQNLCLKELKRNNLEPKEATMARLAIWALKEEKGLVIGSLREDATLIESTISDCSDGKLLKYICVQDQEIDWDDLSEHEDEEIRGCFNAHHSCISDCDSIPDDLLMVTIVHFKLGKLTEAYNKLIHQAFFVPRVKAEIYHGRLSKMAQINNAWKSTYDALALNYLESHRS